MEMTGRLYWPMHEKKINIEGILFLQDNVSAQKSHVTFLYIPLYIRSVSVQHSRLLKTEKGFKDRKFSFNEDVI